MHPDYHSSPCRHRLYTLMRSGAMTLLTLVSVVITMLLIVQETDYEANNLPLPLGLRILNYCVLMFYIVEVCLRIYVEQWAFPREFLNCVDVFVVVVDLGRVLVQSSGGAGFLVLKGLRLVRVSRTIKVMMWLPELAHMIRGLVGALKALLWGSILVLFMLTVWGILATQIVHPLNVELSRQGVWEEFGCERCPRAFSSVGNSMLTFTQQIVAGDSWGLLTVPIIEAYPPTVLFFSVVLLSVQLAIINLILAVILDKANESRQESERELIAFREKEQSKAQIEFMEICATMDEDTSGFLSLDEIMHGYDCNEDFCTTMKAMDIEKDDLEMVFRLMDCDNSGSVAYKEFVDQLFKMKTYDMRTMMVFIRFYVSDMWHKTRVLYREVQIGEQSMRFSVGNTQSASGLASRPPLDKPISCTLTSESEKPHAKMNIEPPMAAVLSSVEHKHSSLASAWAGEVDMATLDCRETGHLPPIFADHVEHHAHHHDYLEVGHMEVEKLREDIQCSLDDISTKLEDQTKLLQTLPLLLERPPWFLPPPVIAGQEEPPHPQKQQLEARPQKQPKAKPNSYASCCRPQREQVVSVT